MIQKTFVNGKDRSIARVTFLVPCCTWVDAVYQFRYLRDGEEWTNDSQAGAGAAQLSRRSVKEARLEVRNGRVMPSREYELNCKGRQT